MTARKNQDCPGDNAADVLVWVAIAIVCWTAAPLLVWGLPW